MDAKKLVDSLDASELSQLSGAIFERRRREILGRDQNGSLLPTADEIQTALHEGLVYAIKKMRQRTNCGLLEAKVAIETAII